MHTKGRLSASLSALPSHMLLAAYSLNWPDGPNSSKARQKAFETKRMHRVELPSAAVRLPSNLTPLHSSTRVQAHPSSSSLTSHWALATPPASPATCRDHSLLLSTLQCRVRHVSVTLCGL